MQVGLFRATVLYLLAVFAAGFVLGTLRVVWLAPALGEIAAVVLEVPVMLGIAWLAAGWCIRRFTVPAKWPARLAMGGGAFALLMIVEIATSLLLGRSPTALLRHYMTVEGAIGLAAQMVFGLIPVLRLWRSG